MGLIVVLVDPTAPVRVGRPPAVQGRIVPVRVAPIVVLPLPVTVVVGRPLAVQGRIVPVRVARIIVVGEWTTGVLVGLIAVTGRSLRKTAVEGRLVTVMQGRSVLVGLIVPVRVNPIVVVGEWTTGVLVGLIAVVLRLVDRVSGRHGRVRKAHVRTGQTAPATWTPLRTVRGAGCPALAVSDVSRSTARTVRTAQPSPQALCV